VKDVELIIHESFDPAFRKATTIRSFEHLEGDGPASVTIGNQTTRGANNYEHAEVKVIVPNGSVVEVITEKPGDLFGHSKLVVPGLDEPLTIDELWDVLQSGKDGFGFVEGAAAR
jgi:hypothetical protein